MVIECLPYQEAIARYDRLGTLFYLDPPYWGSESDYGQGLFGREDFARLAELLRGVRRRFILSLNDVAEVRRLFRGFGVKAIQTSYSIGGWTGARKAAGELIISGPRRRR